VNPATAEVVDATRGSVNFAVELTTLIDETQGWSLGALLTGAPAVITDLRQGTPIETIKEGDPADFEALNWYAPGDLATSQGSCSLADGACAGIAAGAFNQGITIHILTLITIPATDDLEIVAGTIAVDPGTEGEVATLEFSNDVGQPAIATVAVFGGLSFEPSVQDPLEITLSPCSPVPGLSSQTVEPGAFDVTIRFTTDANSDVTVEVDGQSATSSGTDHNVKVTGLAQNTPYSYTITATSVDGGCVETATGNFTTEEAACAPESIYTIDIQGGSGQTGDQMVSVVTLNFDALGDNAGTEIQGWSYGICVDDPSRILPIDCCPGDSEAAAADAIDGTDSATVKEGDPPDFNAFSLYTAPDGAGATHAVTIHILTLITLPARNDYTDMKVTYEMLMSEPGNVEGDAAYVQACNKGLGSPPVENVVVVGGQSIAFNTFEGLDKADPATGCCEGSENCNTPGMFTLSVGPKPVPVLGGDANCDDGIDLADGIFILNYLFQGGPEPCCMLGADFNGDGVVDSSDAVAAIFYVLQPTTDDLQQLTDPSQYGMPPGSGWPGPANDGCVELLPNGLSCEVPSDCTP
jgi:hypothetical protein